MELNRKDIKKQATLMKNVKQYKEQQKRNCCGSSRAE
jgi:hypothetical protein